MKVLVIVSFNLLCLITFGQNATISGYVKDGTSGELLPGAVVYENGSTSGVVTNRYGFYSLTLPAGNHEIVASFIGYSKLVKTVELTGNVSMDFELIQEGETIEEVIVDASETNPIETPSMSTISIPVGNIKEIPALLGEKDVLKTLQLLPGVQSGNEGQTGFYVRGGGPDQNLILLDEAPVYNASHLFGFFSLFNGDALKSVELVKGGFPAKYGGRLSSVLDMTAKEGNRDHLTGTANIGLISASGVIEGPLSKKEKSSFMVSGRRTYADVIMRPLSKSSSGGNESAGYYFYDLIAKANYDVNENNRLFLSGYFGRDKFSFKFDDEISKEKAKFGWGNATGTARWNHIFSPKVFANASLIFSHYDLGIQFQDKYAGEEYKFKYGSGIEDIGFKYDVDFFPNNNHALKAGVQVTRHNFSPRVRVESDTQADINTKEKQEYKTTESALYVQDEMQLGEKVRANLGVRLSHYNQEKDARIKLEPRASLAYILNDVTSVKASYAEMNQYIHLLSNTGAGLPTDLWVPATDDVKPQFSRQFAAGIVRDIYEKDIVLTLEGYYKTMDNIIAYKNGASFADFEAIADGEQSSSNNWEKNVTSGKGDSYGIELLAEKRKGRLHGWAGYTWSKTTHKLPEINNGKPFSPKYDRRHDASIVGMYDLAKNKRLSAVWVFGTGQAVTLPQGKYEALTHSFSRGYVTPGSVTDYGERNGHRMENYHRLDLAYRFSKEKKRGTKSWEFGVYNAYSRANPFFYFLQDDTSGSDSYYKLKNISLFKVIPSITWSFKFK